jgi:hypothetical protein
MAQPERSEDLMPLQYRPQWSIPGAGASESVMNFASLSLDNQGLVNEVRSFFLALNGIIPNDVIITFPAVLTLLDPVEGTLEAEFTVAPPASVAGAAAGGWAGGVGALVQWETGQIIGGRRQRGRTFLVPLASSAFDGTGTLAPTILTNIQVAAQGLLDDLAVLGSRLVVWSRTLGVETVATTAVIPDRSAILRDRRDD